MTDNDKKYRENLKILFKILYNITKRFNENEWELYSIYTKLVNQDIRTYIFEITCKLAHTRIYLNNLNTDKRPLCIFQKIINHGRPKWLISEG